MTVIEFEMEYDSVYQPLYGFAMRLTRNAEDAKDLMQQTALRAFKNSDSFQQGSNFKAWVSTILRNQFINDYRKRRTRNKVEAPVEEFMYTIENEQSINHAYSNIMVQELQSIIGSLPEIYRLPFIMFYRGFHYNEIAERFGLPLGTVKSRLFFARRKLQTEVSARYGSITH